MTLAEPLDDGAFFACGTCGLEYVHPLPPGVPVFQDFTEYGRALFRGLADGASVDEALTPNERLILRELEKDLAPGDAVVELCCESGRFLAALLDRGFRAYGVDPLAEPIAMLKEQGLEVEQGLLEAVPESWPSPKAVVVLESMVRFPEPAELLSEVRRRFPGATLYMSAPSPRQSLKLPDFDRRNAYPPHHLVRWSRKAMEAALRKAGYRARGRRVHVKVNWPLRRGAFGNTLAVVLRVLGQAEYSVLAVGKPR